MKPLFVALIPSSKLNLSHTISLHPSPFNNSTIGEKQGTTTSTSASSSISANLRMGNCIFNGFRFRLCLGSHCGMPFLLSGRIRTPRLWFYPRHFVIIKRFDFIYQIMPLLQFNFVKYSRQLTITNHYFCMCHCEDSVFVAFGHLKHPVFQIVPCLI